MKYDAVKKYYEIMLKRERTSDQMYEALSGMLDKLWYDFTPEELEFTNSLNVPELTNTECCIIAKLNLIKEIEMTTKTYANVFENKEDYLKLRDFWKAFHAEGKHKPVKVEYRTSKPFQSGWGNGDMAFHMESPLTLKHHMIYLAAVGKSLDKAFAPTTYSATKEDLSAWVRWKNGIYPFELFGDAIDPKYYDTIKGRIQEYVNA